MRPAAKPVAALMALEAASLAVMSSLHLTSALAGGSKPYDPTDAGIAEAIICLVLVTGATALIRGVPEARAIALGSVMFAILGFVVGLTLTVRGGSAVDIAYHATVLPLLLVTARLLAAGPKARWA